MTAGNYLDGMPIETATATALRTAGRKVTDWTQQRDDLIRQAVAEGGSLREVGAIVGLSHTAISFIVKGRGPR